MSRRLTNNEIVSRFGRYGFTVIEPNFQYRNNKQRIRVRDDIMNRERTITLNNFQSLIRRGRLPEVDPFLHALNRANTLEMPGQTAEQRRIQKFAETQIPQFANESIDVQRQAVNTADQMMRKALRAQDVTITRTHDSTMDRTNLYAFIGTLYKVAERATVMRNKRITVEIKSQGIESYLFINDNTIGMLGDLIEHVYFGEPLREITDSSTAALFSLVAWDSMSIRFSNVNDQDNNELDGPKVHRRQRNAGALWRYLNKSDIDLSRYGIFRTFDPNNYKYSCFVYALQQSGQFTPEEIDLINDSINTRAFPCDTIKKFCEMFDCYIEVSKYSAQQNALNKKKYYGDKQASKKVSLLLRDAHYMLNESLPMTPYYLRNMERIHASPRVNQERKHQVRNLSDKSVAYHKDPKVSINELINIFFEKKLFKKFTPRQTFRVLNRDKHHDFTDLRYSAKCVKIDPVSDKQVSAQLEEPTVAILDCPSEQMPPLVYTSNIKAFASMPNAQIIKFKSSITKISTPPLGAQALKGQTPTSTIRNLKLLFMFEPTLDELHQFHNIMAERFDVNVFEFDSLAQIGETLMTRYYCYEGVPKLAGKPATFIKECAPRICVQPAFNKPQKVTGSLVQIDKNGSYTATYTQFQGIPKGEPKPMTSTDFINRDMWDYFYVLINVESFKCKHEDRFPILTSTGHFFCDKNTLEFITTHYDVQYSFVSGYYFNEGFNKCILQLAQDLYALRQELKSHGSRIESCIKLILASLWGKAQTKRSYLKNVMVSKDKFEDFAVYNHSFLYKSTPITDDLSIVSLLNPVSLHYTRPQFSTNVLSHARCALNEVFYRAADLNVPIYYSNTDSLVLDTANLNKLGPILGDDLGQFKIERENITKFICISAKKYIQVTPTESKVVGLHKLKNKPENVEEYFENLFASIL